MKRGGFRLTRAAVHDLVGIGRYTTERWGAEQARRYLGHFDARFSAIANDPEAGRPCDELRPGYRRVLQGKHVIFYRLSRRGVVEVIRVLHEQMLPKRHLL